MKISISSSYVGSSWKETTYSWTKVLKYSVAVPGLFIAESQCVIFLWLLHEFCQKSWREVARLWTEHCAGRLSLPEYTSGQVLLIGDRNSTRLLLSVQSPASICLCGRHGLIGWGRRWAQHKLKIMEHFAPKESEGEKYKGQWGKGQQAGGSASRHWARGSSGDSHSSAHSWLMKTGPTCWMSLCSNSGVAFIGEHNDVPCETHKQSLFRWYSLTFQGE